jgi:AcrR family transcriptional regulator
MMIPQQKPTRRQVQKEDTRRIIQDTAYALFAERGYTETTMRILAEHAGVGLGTIFKHFPDKPSLLVAAFQEDLGQITHDAFQALPESGIKEQLLYITRNIYAFYASNPEFSRTLIKETLFLEGEHGQILDRQLTEFLNAISELLRTAAENGELPIETDTHEGARAFGSFYFAGLIMGLKNPVFDVEEQLSFVKALIDHHFIRTE